MAVYLRNNLRPGMPFYSRAGRRENDVYVCLEFPPVVPLPQCQGLESTVRSTERLSQCCDDDDISRDDVITFRAISFPREEVRATLS